MKQRSLNITYSNTLLYIHIPGIGLETSLQATQMTFILFSYMSLHCKLKFQYGLVINLTIITQFTHSTVFTTGNTYLLIYNIQCYVILCHIIGNTCICNTVEWISLLTTILLISSEDSLRQLRLSSIVNGLPQCILKLPCNDFY